MSTTYEPSVRVKHKPKPKPEISHGEMVLIADRLSKIRGRYVSYGDVQKEMKIGKLTVKEARAILEEDNYESNVG